jgi:NAD(P)-dependent dehydrogenase (short-subunit alcohol dehydrogenase family)
LEEYSCVKNLRIEILGKEIALELASNSAENFVIIHGKRKEKCEETLDYLIKENRLENVGNVEYVVADFSSFYEVVNVF